MADKQKQVERFYYSLNKFHDSMKAYEEQVKISQTCLNRRRVVEKNEHGVTKEAKERALNQLDDHYKKSQKVLKEKMGDAVLAFDTIKELVNG